jgi:Cytochrome P460
MKQVFDVSSRPLSGKLLRINPSESEVAAMKKGIFQLLRVGLVLGALVIIGASEHAPAPKPNSRLRYTKDGELVRPDDYRTWVFVGAQLGIQYAPEAGDARDSTPQKYPDGARTVGDFHNVYINPEAYEHYVKAGEFPDKTVLVLDIYAAGQKEPRHIVRAGHFEAEQLRVEVAVKDRGHPGGSKTLWAYYSFPKANPQAGALASTAKPHRDGECYQCHLQHADVDNVWVQFYPTLRMLKKQKR